MSRMVNFTITNRTPSNHIKYKILGREKQERLSVPLLYKRHRHFIFLCHVLPNDVLVCKPMVKWPHLFCDRLWQRQTVYCPAGNIIHNGMCILPDAATLWQCNQQTLALHRIERPTIKQNVVQKWSKIPILFCWKRVRIGTEEGIAVIDPSDDE